MSTSTRPRVTTRARAVAIAGVVVALAAAVVGVLFAVVNIAYLAYSPELSFRVAIATEQAVSLGQPSDAIVTFDTVHIVGREGMEGARNALAGSLLAQYGLFVAVALAIALALWSLARGRDFSRTASRLMLGLGLSTSLLAVTSSVLSGMSTRLAISALELPTSPAGGGDWIIPPGAGIDRGTAILVMIGVALTVVGFYFRAGDRIRRELADVI